MAHSVALCAFLLVLFVGVLEASHFRYGTVTWTKDANYPRNVTFNLNIGMRRTFFGLPNVGDTVTDDYFYFGDGNYVQPTLYVNNMDPYLDLIYISWTTTHTYASAGTFEAEWYSCCRIYGLNNNPSYDYRVSTSVLITPAELSGGPVNSSPVTSILPIVPVQSGVVPFTYQIATSDIDGDARTFRMATTSELGYSGATHPPGLSVSSTGLVTINSTLADGYWCTQQVITDSFGNRIVVDYMLDVRPPLSYCNTTGGCSSPCLSSADCAACGDPSASCLNADPRFVVSDLSSSNVPRTNRPTPQRNSVYSMVAGQTATFTFTADDANLYKTANPVNIQFASLPTRATRSSQVACTSANGCTYVGPYADPQTTSLTFAPITADTGSHVICASAQSMANYLSYAQHCFTIVVSNITDVCGDGIVGVTEACDGGDCCNSDCKSFKSAGTVCSSGTAGDCGSVPQCTGNSATCPTSGSLAPAGTLCRASTGVCDAAEYCTGNSTACPADSFASSSTECRAANGTCDAAEFCTGSSGSCPANAGAQTAACLTPKQYCTLKINDGTLGQANFYCAGTGFYTMCVSGTSNFASKSPCAAGTQCLCAEGVDCSFGGTQSPCTIP